MYDVDGNLLMFLMDACSMFNSCLSKNNKKIIRFIAPLTRRTAINIYRIRASYTLKIFLSPKHLNRGNLSIFDPLQTVSFSRTSEMSSLPPKIKVLLEKVAEAEGLVDFEIVVGSNTKKNVNFLGELISVVVSGKQINANGTKIDKKLDLLCKFAPVHSLNKGLKTEKMYEREIFFYKNVAPAFNRFQEEMKLSPDDRFTSFPKCYDAVCAPEDDTCVIIMQDLRSEGFALWPNEKPTPFERVRLIVEELAKFHAISFAMKDQRPEQFAEFTKLDDFVRVFLTVDHFEAVFRQSIERAMKALRSEEHKSIFRECLQNYRDVCNNCLQGRFSDESCVVTHGDCWKNNVIYRSAVSERRTEAGS